MVFISPKTGEFNIFNCYAQETNFFPTPLIPGDINLLFFMSNLLSWMDKCDNKIANSVNQ